MSLLDREIALRLSVQRALLGAISSGLAAVACGWNDNQIVLEFLVDFDFSDEERKRLEVVASEVVADFSHETITTVFTSPPSDGPKLPATTRWWAYRRFQPDDISTEQELDWPLVLQVLALVDRLFREKASWPDLIKRVRGESGVDILTAEKIVLTHHGWRRLCSYRINHDPECKRQASQHIKIHGPSSLIFRTGSTLVIAEPEIAAK